MLIAAAADVNAKNRGGETPLHNAVSRPRTQVAELLIAKGAAINAPDADGLTPLHSAVAQGNLAAVKLLLANKAELNARDAEAKTPLDYCQLPGMTRRLQAAGAKYGFELPRKPKK